MMEAPMKCLLAALLLAVPVLAHADDDPRVDDDPTHAEAKRLSELGADALQRQEYPIALHDFESAYALFPSPKLHYNMALAHDGIGQPAETRAEFKLFLSAAPDAPSEQREYAEKRIAALAPKVALLTVQGAAGQIVLVDGHPAGPAPLDVEVDVGEHHVSQADRGSVSLFVAEGDHREVKLVELLAANPPHRPLVKQWWFWTGVSAAVLAGTLVAIWIATTPHAPPSDLGNFDARP
jgi:hypothetical protein